MIRSLRNPKRKLLASAALLVMSICAMGMGYFINPKEPPTTRVTDCTTSGCHAEQTKFTFMHAPAGVGACEVCHQFEDPAKHTFKLIDKHNGEPICSFCHIGKSTFGRDDNWAGRHVHQPVKEGECVACHNPHGSNMRKLIKAESISGLCSSCHTDVLGQKHSHPAVGERECLNCHQPHSGEFPKLLHQVGRDLCMTCHSKVLPGAEAMTPQARNSAASQVALATLGVVGATVAINPDNHQEDPKPAFIHKPVEGECTQCHNPHGSAYEHMLKQNVGNLCSSCHEDVAKSIMHAGVKHSAVEGDRACLNCHAPHHSKTDGLLLDRPMTVCLDCHDKKITMPNGRVIASLKYLEDKGMHAHGPVGNAKCIDCHDVHGGDHGALLVGNYSQKFYQSFEGNAYELCFSCHDQNLATQQRTTTATNFRNGDVNLHYVHISQQGENGRSCRMCHAEHASKSSHMLRDSVPYGEWNLPIRFKDLDNGGTCAAGCHRERGYDRSATNPASTPPPP